jgi:hypothetical protein
VKGFFDVLLPMLKPLQYQYGGPIIAMQVQKEISWNNFVGGK